MNPFEFIILFFSFIYTLALTHLLFAWTRMIRYRRKLVFSWPHLLWMLVAFLNLAENWISTWDFRTMGQLSLLAISSAFFFVILNYFLCALVSPDFDDGEADDLQRFHRCEGPTYITAFLVMVVVALVENFAAGARLGFGKEGAENALVIFYVPIALLPLFVKQAWAQIAAPAALIVAAIAYAVMFYPVLTI
jgi:hypothetical protein